LVGGQAVQPLVAENFGILAYSGYNLTNTFGSDGSFLVQNVDTVAHAIYFLNANDTVSTNGQIPIISRDYTGFTGGQPVSVVLENLPGGGFITVPAGTTIFVNITIKFTWGAVAQTGSKMMTHTIRVKEDSNGAARNVTFTRSGIFTAVASGATFNPQANSDSCVGYNTASPQAIISGTTAMGNWGSITIGAEPYGSEGKITAMGATVSTTGGKRITIALDGETEAEVLAMPNLDGNGNPVPTTIPPLIYSTDNPLEYGIGKHLTIHVNGKLVASQTVEADANGNFNIVKDLSATNGTSNALIVDGDGNEIPVNDDEEVAMDTDADDPSHGRVDPGPIPGTDPKGDATVDSDGPGPGTGLSVGDSYRATRAAIEDALHTKNSGDSFSFGAWEAVEHGGGESDTGKGLGEGLGGGFNAMAGTIGEKSVTMPVGSPDGVFLRYLAGNVTLPVLTPSWAGVIRTVCLVFLSIGFFLALVGIVRGAFAGR
jgi:hypothetical protein